MSNVRRHKKKRDNVGRVPSSASSCRSASRRWRPTSRRRRISLVCQSENGGQHGFAELPTLRRVHAQPKSLGPSGGVNPHRCARGTRHGHAGALRQMRPRICSKRPALQRGCALQAITPIAVACRRSVLGLGAHADPCSLSTRAHRPVPPNPSIEGMHKRLRLLCTPHVKR